MNHTYIQRGIEDGFLNSQYSSVKSIAIMVDRISNNQAYVYLCMQMRKYYETHASPDLQVYSVYSEPPFEFPSSGLYDMRDLVKYKGPILPTSTQTLAIALKQWRCTVPCYYMYDITDIESENFLALIPELLERKVVLILRSNEHIEAVRRRHPQLHALVCNNPVPDFNMERLMKIWQEKQK